MPKMSAGDLKALLSAERYDALSAMAASQALRRTRVRPQLLHGRHVEGHAGPGRAIKAVSSDVADTIEGLMPPLMEIFAAGEEVVRFAPVGPEDVAAAEQETDYVNHVFMQQNPGFLVLYSFIKDALLSKVGVVKVWWECRTEVERETYLDQPDDAFAMIVSQPGVEIVEHTERGIDSLMLRPRSESAFTRVSDALSAASRSMSSPPSFETGAIAREDGRQAPLRRPPQDEGGGRPQAGLPHPSCTMSRSRSAARANARGRGRHAGRIRNQPARALDQGPGLLLPRRVPHQDRS